MVLFKELIEEFLIMSKIPIPFLKFFQKIIHFIKSLENELIKITNPFLLLNKKRCIFVQILFLIHQVFTVVLIVEYREAIKQYLFSKKMSTLELFYFKKQIKILEIMVLEIDLHLKVEIF